MTVTVDNLASGSSGNALLIRTNATTLLVDCGINKSTLRTELAKRDLSVSDLGAMLLTHEHSDHVKSLEFLVLSGIPIVTTGGTAKGAGVPNSARELVAGGSILTIGNIEINVFTVSHDSAEPVGFFLEAGGIRVLVATDLGEPAPCLVEMVAAADLVVLEANHDLEMLRKGPYPSFLKQRVLSKHGHLSNDDCGAVLSQGMRYGPGGRTVWLAHLSTTNNRPPMAIDTVHGKLGQVAAQHSVVPMARYGGQTWVSSLPVERPVFSAPVVTRQTMLPGLD